MALQRTNLGYPAYLGTYPAAAVYTNAANTSAYVKGIFLHNTTTNNASVSVYIVPNGGSASLSNRLYQVSLQSQETLLLPFGVDQYPFSLITPGDSIQANASLTSTVVSFVVGDKNI